MTRTDWHLEHLRDPSTCTRLCGVEACCYSMMMYSQASVTAFLLFQSPTGSLRHDAVPERTGSHRGMDVMWPLFISISTAPILQRNVIFFPQIASVAALVMPQDYTQIFNAIPVQNLIEHRRAVEQIGHSAKWFSFLGENLPTSCA